MQMLFNRFSGTGIINLVLSLVLAGSTALGATAPQPAPGWELKDVTGKTVKLSDFKGKVVVLDFWATWCAPCRDEIPGFNDLQKKYAAQGLVIVGVSLDEEGATAVAPFLKKTAMDYTIVIGNPEVVQKYGDIQGIPATFIIDRQGNIVGGHEGFTEKAAFESEIKPLL